MKATEFRLGNLTFRAWDIESKSYVKGEHLMTYCKGIHMTIAGVSIDSEDESSNEEVIIEQSTGKLDKNGKEIFLGDINQDKGVVVWNEDSASFCWEYKDIELMSFEGESEWCEVTSNIHEPIEG